MTEIVEALIDGGSASAGPPLGPALGPLGVNIGEVVKAINEKTRAFAGMKVPVKIAVDTKTRKFDIEVGVPPVTALIKKELGLEKGASNRKEPAGNLSFEQVVRIAEMKADDLSTPDLKKRVKQVLGTCLSMGVTVDGRDARKVQLAVNGGEYDDRLN